MAKNNHFNVFGVTLWYDDRFVLKWQQHDVAEPTGYKLQQIPMTWELT